MTPEQLRTYRTVLGMTRKQFAALVGYDYQYIYLLESGKNPITPKTERKILGRLAAEKKSFQVVIDKVSELVV